MFKKVKEILNDKFDETKRIRFFLVFYFIIFTLALIFIKTNNKEEVIEKEKLNNSSNYSFRYEIEYEAPLIVLSGSVYNNYMVFDKIVDGLREKYLIYFNEVYKLESDEYIKIDYLIENFDNKLLNLEYIKDVIEEGTQVDEEGLEFFNEKRNINIKFSFLEDTEEILLTKDNINIKYIIYDYNKVKPFDINIKH